MLRGSASKSKSDIKSDDMFSSYQQGSGAGNGSYVPPKQGQAYADEQTGVLTDTVKTQYQAETTANVVLEKLTQQRQQISGADNNVWKMRQATEQTKRELQELKIKYREKKRKLYYIIALIGFIDFMMFARIVRCRGGFFCLHL